MSESITKHTGDLFGGEFYGEIAQQVTQYLLQNNVDQKVIKTIVLNYLAEFSEDITTMLVNNTADSDLQHVLRVSGSQLSYKEREKIFIRYSDGYLWRLQKIKDIYQRAMSEMVDKLKRDSGKQTS